MIVYREGRSSVLWLVSSLCYGSLKEPKLKMWISIHAFFLFFFFVFFGVGGWGGGYYFDCIVLGVHSNFDLLGLNIACPNKLPWLSLTLHLVLCLSLFSFCFCHSAPYFFPLSPFQLCFLSHLSGSRRGGKKSSLPHEAANRLISMGFRESILTSREPLK